MKILDNSTPKILQYYRQFYKDILHTGSRVIVDENDWDAYPPQDDDWLIFIDKSHLEPLEDFLEFDGFERGGSLAKPEYEYLTIGGDKYYRENKFIAWREVPKDHVMKNTTKEDDSVFTSWKKTDDGEVLDPEGRPAPKVLNVIITWDEGHFDTFKKATALAKALNLKTKQERVILFEAINRGIWPDNLSEAGSQNGETPELPEEITDKKLAPSEEVLSDASKKTARGSVSFQKWYKEFIKG